MARERKTISSTRKQRGKSATSVQHHYQVVTFDACIKRLRPSRTGQRASKLDHEEKTLREVDPTTTFYIKRSILAGKRHLDPARCSRWKRKRTVPVCSYERRVPKSLALIKERFTRVIASEFQM